MGDIVEGINFQNERPLRFIKEYQNTKTLPRYILADGYLRTYDSINSLLSDWAQRLPAEYHPILDEMLNKYNKFKQNETIEGVKVDGECLNADLAMLFKRLDILKIRFKTPTIRPDTMFKSEVITLIRKIVRIYKLIVRKQPIDEFDVFMVKVLKKHFDQIIAALLNDMLKMDKIIAKYVDKNHIANNQEYKKLHLLRNDFEQMVNGLRDMRKFLSNHLFEDLSNV